MKFIYKLERDCDCYFFFSVYWYTFFGMREREKPVLTHLHSGVRLRTRIVKKRSYHRRRWQTKDDSTAFNGEEEAERTFFSILFFHYERGIFVFIIVN